MTVEELLILMSGIVTEAVSVEELLNEVIACS